MNVAEQYPAVTDANGRTWYRPVRPAGADFSQWGWTGDADQAHPDYGPHVVEHVASGARVRCGGPGACAVCDEALTPAVRELGDPAALFDAAAYGVAYVAVRPS
ncbi:hypothetical protein SEA_PEANAM_83 [Mycobacterium phage Peanam]|nr:hypothetical protein SEA_PEANAM_83 [Mycobacterium phage Peanam]